MFRNLAKIKIMEDRNKTLLDEILYTAFQQLHGLNYKITEYSLNSAFSFKFENLSHFIEFLKQNEPINNDKQAFLEIMMNDLNLKLDSFFYVNFFE